MNNAIIIKNSALAAIAAAGAFIANQLGGWDAFLKVLVGFMAADYVTGLALAGIWKRSPKSETGALESKASFKGLCKKSAIIMIVWIAVLLDDAIGAEYIRAAVVLCFVGNEGLSLCENLALMGVPFPAFFKKALEALRDKGDGGAKD